MARWRGSVKPRHPPLSRSLVATLLTSSVLFGCGAARSPASPVSSPRPGSTVPGSEAHAPPAPLPEIVFDVVPPDSQLDAVGTSLLGRHEAWLERFHGTVTFVPAEIARSHVEVELDMTSLTMSVPAFTRTLRGKRFFDVEKYPRARFVSTAIASTDRADVYRVAGTLEMHGHTRPVSFEATVVRGSGWATARGEVRLDRHDFGLVYDGPLDKLADDIFVVKIWAQGTSR